jgi:WD40 repeat protein
MLDLAALTSGRSFEESTLWRIKAHDGGIPLAPFSSDGLLIASIGMEGRTKAWNTQDGTLVADLPTPVFANGNWHPNGTHVMVDHQGTIQVLTIDTTELIDIARSRITRGFTADECATYHIDPCPDLEKIRGG